MTIEISAWERFGVAGYIYNIQVLFDKLLIIFKYFLHLLCHILFAFLCTLSDDVTETATISFSVETTFLHSRKVFSVGDSSASYDSCRKVFNFFPVMILCPFFFILY